MHPHPHSDATGHSRGEASEKIDPSDDFALWELHCRAVDLFNEGYYWEAHEAWESLWIAKGRRGPQADFVKGLIKLAAAGIKGRQGKLTGVERHARCAAALFRYCAEDAGLPSHQTLGLCADRLHQKSLQTLHSAASILDSTRCAVRRVLPLVLVPLR